MSATGRGRERVDFDFYPTCPWIVHRLLDRHGDELFPIFRPDVLEPTVGDGAIIRACDEWFMGRKADCEPNWTGVELRRGALIQGMGTVVEHHFEGVDFRGWYPEKHGLAVDLYDLSIGNPPFSIAESVIRHCLEMSRATAMLLRLGFLSSAERVDFWRGCGADPIVRVLPDRPSFDGLGTDSATYAWFIWGAELSGPRVDVLDTTPASVRNAQKPQLPTGIPQLGLNWLEPQDCND